MFQHNTNMMSQATQAIFLTTQTCVVTTQFTCKNSYNYVRGNTSEMFYNTNLCGNDTIKMSKSNTRMMSESTQVICFTSQTCVEMGITQAFVCG